MGNISEKDKKILTVLGCVVLVIIFSFWVIPPLKNANDDLTLQIEQAENEKMVMEDKIMRQESARIEAEQSLSDAKMAAELYFPVMRSQQIDGEITKMVLAQGVKIEDMKITMPEENLWIVPYTFAQPLSAEATDTEGNESDATSVENVEESQDLNSSDAPEGATGQAQVVSAAHITLKISGSQEQFWATLESFDKFEKAIRITKIETTTMKVAGGEQQQMAIELDLYLCDKQTIVE